ncbi:hypothetical protein SCHIN_v1c05930 [Spiroplasma chinense]|uniref:Acyltransferase 3 domain-containing protein n=1 Tax=Spiroplasma chinense TaxID=216932 RepID=A0A5B9Y4A5_9MOLU|nr:acyltransferase family protein [Spiroplasma chinense]QEH61790.1 hypothetical protein SCHIN_v1c05930 [Spiroplasma chinense]
MRNSNIEITRFICIFLIIFSHQFSAQMPYDKILLREIMAPMISVPIYIFMLISGYFKSTSKNYNFMKILFTVFLCYILNWILAPGIMYLVNGHWEFTSFILGGRDWWYMWAFLVIQLFVPLLNLLLNKIKVHYLILVLIISYIILLTNNATKYGQNFTIDNIAIFIILYLVGGVLKLYCDFSKIKWRYIFLSLILVSYSLNLVFRATLKLFFWHSVNDLSLAIFAIMVFCFIISFKPTKNKVFDFLGTLTLFIYLFHYLFENLNNHFIGPLIGELNVNLRYLILSINTMIFTFIYALIIFKPVLIVSQKIANQKVFKNLFIEKQIFN